MEGFGRKSASAPPARASAPVAGGSANQRFAPRRAGQVPALIYLEGGVQGLPCLIRDMSTTGAKLEMREGWDNPFKCDASQLDRIRLVIRQDRVMYDCKIIRRGDKDLGVKFMSAAKPMTKAR